MYITDSGTTGNVVEGNYIGTNAAGSAAVPNYGSGVVILNGAADNIIGGSSTAAGDIISGNSVDGVDLGSGRGFQHGRERLPRHIRIRTRRSSTCPTRRAAWRTPSEARSYNGIVDDAIAYNEYGVYLTSSGTVGNMVEGDSIWSNTVDGVCFTNGASDTFITGSLISTNGNNGVEVDANSDE